MAERPQTYETFLLHSLMPATDWQAVYWQAQVHRCVPLHALALVTRTVRDVHTNKSIKQFAQELEEDRRDIVGLEYNPSDGWTICNDMTSFCGLMPPGWTLADVAEHCTHQLEVQTPQEQGREDEDNPFLAL